MSAIDNAEEKIIFSQASLDKRDVSVRFHSHPSIELILITEGSCRIGICNDNYLCTPGDLVVIPPETPHNQTQPTCNAVSFIVFTCPLEIFDGSFRIINVSSDPWCIHLFCDICKMSEEKLYELCNGMLPALLCCITMFEKHNSSLHGLHPALRKAVDILEHNYWKELPMEQLAKEVGVSYTYLRKLFARQYHYAPVHYLQNLRMAKARQLLLNATLNVSDVAEACGYPDCNYFIRLFRKIHQCSPSQYKQVMRDRPSDSFIRM